MTPRTVARSGILLVTWQDFARAAQTGKQRPRVTACEQQTKCQSVRREMNRRPYFGQVVCSKVQLTLFPKLPRSDIGMVRHHHERCRRHALYARPCLTVVIWSFLSGDGGVCRNRGPMARDAVAVFAVCNFFHVGHSVLSIAIC